MSDDHGLYADWDAAYVLGSLSPAERREFEIHLEGCARCRAGVAELTGLPGLLGRLDPARAFELLDSDDAVLPPDADGQPVPPPPADLVARIESRRAAARRRRVRLVVGIAAAAVVTGAVAVPVAIATTPQHPTFTTALSRVVDSPLSADVTLTSVGWGTKVDMSCHYGDTDSTAPASTRWDYALWVVKKDGTASELSSWSAANNSTIKLSAGTALPVSQIASLQVRSIPDGAVLLSSDLHGRAGSAG